MTAVEPPTYSITTGGPLRRLERALRITRGDRHDVYRRVVTAVAIGYVPFVAALVVSEHLLGGSLARVELLTHVRVLIAIPLLIAAEWVLDERAAEVGEYLQHASLVVPEHVEAHRAAVAKTARLRDSPLFEIVLLVAVLGGAIDLPTFTRESAIAIRWSMLPALLLYRFLLLRLLWRWALWGLYLGRIARLPLALRAGHPDRVAGLEPLAGPSVAFGMVVMACAALLCAGWGDRMRFDGAAATMFTFEALTYVFLALFVALAPLLVFTRVLVTMRRHGTHAYGALAKHFVDAFEGRWLARSGDELLDVQAISHLNDLDGAVERVPTMRVVVAPRAVIQTVLAAAMIPLLPLVVAELGALELLERLAKALL